MFNNVNELFLLVDAFTLVTKSPTIVLFFRSTDLATFFLIICNEIVTTFKLQQSFIYFDVRALIFSQLNPKPLLKNNRKQ